MIRHVIDEPRTSATTSVKNAGGWPARKSGMISRMQSHEALTSQKRMIAKTTSREGMCCPAGGASPDSIYQGDSGGSIAKFCVNTPASPHARRPLRAIYKEFRAMKTVCTCILILACAAPLWGQDFKSPPGKTPSAETLKAIKEKTDKLAKMVNVLTSLKVRDPGLAEVEIYLEAARKIVEHNEFFQAEAG